MKIEWGVYRTEGENVAYFCFDDHCLEKDIGDSVTHEEFVYDPINKKYMLFYFNSERMSLENVSKVSSRKTWSSLVEQGWVVGDEYEEEELEEKV